MESTTYLKPSEGVDDGTIRQCLEDYYAEKPFIRLLPNGQFPDTFCVRGTNFCDIGWKIDPGSGRMILMSVIDNLVKVQRVKPCRT